MQQTDLITHTNKKIGKVVNQLIALLAIKGLSVTPSFDFQIARATSSACACPHHGTTDCDCQIIVLLVYQGKKPPVSLLLHGHDGQTTLEIVNVLYQTADPEIMAILEEAVAVIEAGLYSDKTASLDE